VRRDQVLEHGVGGSASPDGHDGQEGSVNHGGLKPGLATVAHDDGIVCENGGRSVVDRGAVPVPDQVGTSSVLGLAPEAKGSENYTALHTGHDERPGGGTAPLTDLGHRCLDHVEEGQTMLSGGNAGRGSLAPGEGGPGASGLIKQTNGPGEDGGVDLGNRIVDDVLCKEAAKALFDQVLSNAGELAVDGEELSLHQLAPEFPTEPGEVSRGLYEVLVVRDHDGGRCGRRHKGGVKSQGNRPGVVVHRTVDPVTQDVALTIVNGLGRGANPNAQVALTERAGEGEGIGGGTGGGGNRLSPDLAVVVRIGVEDTESVPKLITGVDTTTSRGSHQLPVVDDTGFLRQRLYGSHVGNGKGGVLEGHQPKPSPNDVAQSVPGSGISLQDGKHRLPGAEVAAKGHLVVGSQALLKELLAEVFCQLQVLGVLGVLLVGLSLFQKLSF